MLFLLTLASEGEHQQGRNWGDRDQCGPARVDPSKIYLLQRKITIIIFIYIFFFFWREAFTRVLVNLVQTGIQVPARVRAWLLASLPAPPPLLASRFKAGRAGSRSPVIGLFLGLRARIKSSARSASIAAPWRRSCSTPSSRAQASRLGCRCGGSRSWNWYRCPRVPMVTFTSETPTWCCTPPSPAGASPTACISGWVSSEQHRAAVGPRSVHHPVTWAG